MKDREGFQAKDSLHFVLTSIFCLYPCMSVFAGAVSGNSEPQPEAGPDSPGPGTGLLPGDRPAESPRHPLQKWVREESRWSWMDRWIDG